MAPDSKKEHPLLPEPLAPGVILTDAQIRELVQSSHLIEPATFEERGLDACSYDVRIGRKGVIGGEGRELDLTKETLEINPGAYAAAISLEKVKIPNNIVVRINAKRSVAYLGVALLTGSQIDPGYEGHLLFGFYNASSRKTVLRAGRSICSLVFEALAGPVSRPKPSDPDLLYGNFPDNFINDMANMEVLSLQQLSEQIKQLDKISRDMMDLRAKYDNVAQPIKDLTANVDKLSIDVDKLRQNLSELQALTTQNAQTVRDIGTNVQTIITQVGALSGETTRLSDRAERHEREIAGLSKKYGIFYVLVYIISALVLLVLGGVFTQYVLPKLFGTPPAPVP